MPVLKEQTKREITIPTDDPSDPVVLTVKSPLLVNDVTGIAVTDKEKYIYALIATSIVMWNYVDPTGAPLPVTAEAVSKMPAFVIFKLTEELGFTGLTDTQKKTSS